MFHYTRFGEAGKQLLPFADLAGFVPEQGDRLQDFHYLGSEMATDEEWRQWVEAAVEATRRIWRGERVRAFRDW
ncbi:MAG: hypothetical protein OWU84_00440 [Firmicutes bacterium]|nr:hypothetical protein [Bacillota bacterium]